MAHIVVVNRILLPPSIPDQRLATIIRADPIASLAWWLRHDRSLDFGSPSAFGVPSVGGSFAGADPSLELGRDPRDLALRAVVRRSLAG